MNKSDLPKHLQMYFRKVMASPQGTIAHDGDCAIYRVSVCDCGLLHHLRVLSYPDELYENYWEENSEHQSILENLFLKESKHD